LGSHHCFECFALSQKCTDNRSPLCLFLNYI
jgi:hypothetical protein